METPKKSTSTSGHTPTLSSIAREEAQIAFANKLISHNQYAIKVATFAPDCFNFAPVTGEDVENCADLLCKNECANRKRVDRYVKGEKFDKNLVPALIKALPESRRAIANQRISALFGNITEEIYDFTTIKMSAIKETSEATAAIAGNASLAVQAKEIKESIEAQTKVFEQITTLIAKGES